MSFRISTFCTLATALLMQGSSIKAQPIEANPVNKADVELPLRPLKLDDWLAQHGGLSRLTLKMGQATQSEIAAEMQKQTGIAITTQMNPNDPKPMRFSVEASGQPFWQAIKEWHRGGLPLDVDSGFGRSVSWMLGQRMQDYGNHYVTAGPCLLTAVSATIERRNSLNYSPKVDTPKVGDRIPAEPSQSSTNTLSIQSRIRIDPKLLASVGILDVEVEGAEDDLGNIIKAGAGSYGSHTNDVFYRSLNLEAPVAGAKVLSQLKGIIRIATITRRESWTVDLQKTPNAEKTFTVGDGSTTYRFGGVSGTDGVWKVKLVSTHQGVDATRVFVNRSGGRSTLSNLNGDGRRVQCVDATGNPMFSAGSSMGINKVNGISTTDMEFRFMAAPQDKDLVPSPPSKITLDIPLDWREVHIPFDLVDLPLPPA